MANSTDASDASLAGPQPSHGDPSVGPPPVPSVDPLHRLIDIVLYLPRQVCACLLWALNPPFTSWHEMLAGSHFIKFLEYAGRVTVLIAALSWIFGAEDRHEAKVRQLWQTVYSTRGHARFEALQALHGMRESMYNLDLERAILTGIDLCHADLRRADLRGADLSRANLRGADLSGADLKNACLHGANLHDAKLCGSDLRHADLSKATLTSVAFSEDTLLTATDLSDANLTKARGLVVKNPQPLMPFWNLATKWPATFVPPEGFPKQRNNKTGVTACSVRH